MGKSTWSLEVLVTIEMLYNQQFVNHIIHGACCTCAVAYPEGFRRRYTGLGAQTMCPNY